LVDAERRRRDEEERAQRLSKRYQDFRSLKQQIRSGQSDLAAAFMQTSGELVDEFRSSKQFYSWDKYLKFLGRAGNSATQGQAAPQSQLDEMAARLTKSGCLLIYHDQAAN
jgi:general transcription factor 3C polypeptide 3 (transcription factor C subunit 4)